MEQMLITQSKHIWLQVFLWQKACAGHALQREQGTMDAVSLDGPYFSELIYL